MPYGINVDVSIPAGRKEGIKLTPDDAERIAVGMSEVLGRPLHSDWVQIRKLPQAGWFRITIVEEDVMSRVHPFHDEPGWVSITDPVRWGYELDGTPYAVRLDRHGLVTGRARWGKSSLINVSWAHIMCAADAELWVAGSEKLYDALAGWLEPYRDRPEPHPFGLIKSGLQDTVDMLAALMRIARWRQKQPLHMRRWPTIVGYVDEASFPLQRTDITAVYEGARLNASQLSAMIMRAAGSSGVWLWLASQRGTIDNWGPEGGLINSQAMVRVAFASADWAEVGRAMGDYRLSMPRHRGEAWVGASDQHDLPSRIKCEYIQEMDPQRDVLHNGPTVADVSWARRMFRVGPDGRNPRGLDAGSAQIAGPIYQTRITHMGTELEAYLTEDDRSGSMAVAVSGGSGPLTISGGGDAFAAARAELDALLGAPQPLGSGDAGVTSMVDRRPRKDRVLEILRQAGGPLERSAILAALVAQGDDCHPNTLTNLLADMRGRSLAAQPDGGTGWVAV